MDQNSLKIEIQAGSRISIKLFLFFGVFFTFFHASAQMNKKGDILIEPYFGAPNFNYGEFVYSSTLLILNGKETSNSHYRPVGLKFNYFVRDYHNIAFDFFINGSASKGTCITDSIYDDVQKKMNYTTGRFKYNVNRVRAQFRYNYHFDLGIDSTKLDTYCGFGMGYNGNFSFLSIKEENQDLTINEKIKNSAKKSESLFKSFNSAFFPISMRFCLGLHYNFNEYFGINTELALGGPIFTFGLSFRY